MCKTQKDTKNPPVLQTDPSKMRGSTNQVVKNEVTSDSLQTSDAYAFQNKLALSREDDAYSPKDTYKEDRRDNRPTNETSVDQSQ